MARIEVTMPKMGESITEGTVVEWAKKIGDKIEQDETLLEIATDKVDSEVPAPEAGILVEILVGEGETVEVGEPIAILETDPDAAADAASGDEKADSDGEETGEDFEEETSESEEDAHEGTPADEARDEDKTEQPEPRAESQNGAKPSQKQEKAGLEASRDGKPDREKAPTGPAGGDTPPQRKGSDGRFFSPLVRAIAREEGISQEELESIEGSGSRGRVTKQDVLDYVESGKDETASSTGSTPSGLRKPGDAGSDSEAGKAASQAGEDVRWPGQNVEIIKMDRMRKVISEHMIRSKQTSAHVTTFGEADVTRLAQFRDKHKDRFQKEHGFKLTFTPFFVEATIQALREFPLVNSSVDGDTIVLKKNINYGIAVALGEDRNGGLIVPVIKNAGEMNLQGLARQTHQLALKARSKQLSPDDLVGGTFTFTNYGSVGNLMGTPIINQPQVAIFGTGIIQKRPVVIEVDGSDTIAIRNMVYLSMSYDHRIIDGAMGGAFVQRVKQLLEQFDVDRAL
ncbi:MAG: dihydrolipoamide acetyltransferase family protein [Cyclonatronaceae bacterium]